MEKRLLIIFAFIYFLFYSTYSFGEFTIGGSLQNRSSLTAGKDYKFLNSSILEFDTEYKDSNIRVFSDLRIGLLYGFGANAASNPDNILSQAFMFTKGDFTLALDIARLYMKINNGIAIWTVGRTYLNFGETQMFNVLEWYKNFSFIDPLATKPAVNIVSLDIALGEYGKLKMFAGSDDKWKYPIAGAELILGTSGFEGGLDYQYKGENKNVIGTFFKADVFITIYGSYALHLDNILINKDKMKISHEASLGGDYSFSVFYTSKLVIQEIFYINSIGAKTDGELLTMAFGDYYFRGFAYSYSSLQLTIDEFYSVQADCFVNMTDGSGVVIPQFSMNIFSNLSLRALVAVFFGKKGSEFGPSDVMPNCNVALNLTASF